MPLPYRPGIAGPVVVPVTDQQTVVYTQTFTAGVVTTGAAARQATPATLACAAATTASLARMPGRLLTAAVTTAASWVRAAIGFTLANTLAGPQGTAVLQANSGGALGSAFATVVNNSGSTCTYDYTQPPGFAAAKCFAATGNASFLDWSPNALAGAQQWFRLYIWISAYPTNTTRFAYADNPTRCARWGINATTGTITIDASVATGVASTTQAVARNKWVRIEGYVIGAPGSGGTVYCEFFNNYLSATPTDQAGPAIAQNTAGVPTDWNLGLVSAPGGTNYAMWVAYPAVSDLGPLGPAAIVNTTGLASPVAATATLARTPGRLFTAAATAAAVAARQPGNVLAAAVSAATGPLTRQAARALAAACSPAPALIRKAATAPAGTAVTVTAAAQKLLAPGTALAAAVTATGTVTRAAGRLLAAASATGGLVTFQASKLLTAGAGTAGTLTRAFARLLGGAVTTTATELAGFTWTSSLAGPAGTAVSPANSAALGKAFTAVTLGGGGGYSLAYDYTEGLAAGLGLAAAKITVPSPGNATTVTWTIPAIAGNQHWWRLYVYLTAYPTVQAFRLVFSDNGSTLCARWGINPTGSAVPGSIEIDTAGATPAITTTSAIPLNQWVRLEGWVIGASANGSASVSIYTNPLSATPAETKTTLANQNTNGTPVDWKFGIASGVGGAYSMSIAFPGISDLGPLGPAALVNTAALPSPVTVLPAIGRAAARGLGIAAAVSGSVVRQIGRAVTGTQVTASGAVARRTSPVPLTAAAAATASSSRRAGRTLAGQVSVAAADQVLAARTLTVAVAGTARIGRQAARLVTVTVAATGSATRQAARAMTAAVASAVAVLVTRQNVRAFTAAVTTTAVLARQAAPNLRTAVPVTGTIGRQAARTLAGTASTAGSSVARQAARTLTAAVAAPGSVTVLKNYLRSFTGQAAASSGLARVTGRTAQAAAGTAGTMARQASRTATAQAATTGQLARQASRTHQVAAAATGTLGRGISRTITASTTSAGTVTRAAARAIGTQAAAAGTLARAAARTVAAAVSATAGPLARQPGKTLPAGVTATGTTGRQVRRTVTVTATAAGNLAAVSALLRTWAAQASASAAVTRLAGRNLTATATTAAVAGRAASRILAATVTGTGTTVRGLSRVLGTTAATTAAAGLVKIILRSWAASASTTAALVRQPGRTMAAPVTMASAVSRMATRSVTVTVTAAPALARRISRATGVSAATAATLSLRTARSFGTAVPVQAQFAQAVLRVLAAQVTVSGRLAVANFYIRVFSAVTRVSGSVVTVRLSRGLFLTLTIGPPWLQWQIGPPSSS